MRKLFVLLMVLCLLSFNAAASGEKEGSSSSAAKPVELLFWHTFGEGSEIDCFNEVVDAFELQNPNIQINAVRMPFDGLQQQIIAAIAGNVAPDVMRVDPTWVGKIASMGGLVKLDDFDGFPKTKENALEGPLNTGYLNGSYYALPLGTNTTLAIWNMDLLRKNGIDVPPATIDELIRVAKAYSNPKEEEYFFTIAGTHTWAILPWFWSMGGQVTNDTYTQATGYLDSEASIAAISEIASWYQNKVISPAIVGEQPDAWAASTGGTLPLVVDGPWFFTSVNVPFETRATVIPAGKGGSVSIVGGEDVIMIEGTRHEQEAWTFMQFLVSDEAQLIMSKSGMIPTTKSALSKLDVSQNNYMQAFVEQLNSTNVRVPSKNYPEIDSYLGTVFERIVRGESSAEAAMKEAAIKIDELLK